MRRRTASDTGTARGFTLIELVAVIALIGIISGFAVWKLGNFTYWREETSVRKLIETMRFLHHQAVFDQAFYGIEINLENPDRHSYKVGVFNEAPLAGAPAAVPAAGGPAPGLLTLELSKFISPDIGTAQTFIPPPTFPSLAEAVDLPDGMVFEDIRTMEGKIMRSEGGRVYIQFSPRGYSDFAVLHLRTSTNQPLTLLVNPFTGAVDLIRDYKDFRWTYGKKKR